MSSKKDVKDDEIGLEVEGMVTSPIDNKKSQKKKGGVMPDLGVPKEVGSACRGL